MRTPDEQIDLAYGRMDFADLHGYGTRRTPVERTYDAHARGEHDAAPAAGCYACEIAAEPQDLEDTRYEAMG